MRSPIYLDYAATTPVEAAVARAMYRCLTSDQEFGNPASVTHEFGRRPNALIEAAREQVAALIGARPQELIWTSGATEADNLALLGAARFRRLAGRHIVTVVTEHPAVLEACRVLENEGFRVTYLRPSADGIVEPAAVAAALSDETILVSIMHVNNEIGVVQDIGAIGALCRARDVLLHVDAAQSAGRMPIDVRDLCIDLLSLSAHKMYGPKGVGALYLNAERIRRVEPLMHGGGQERDLRPGTLPTHQIVGMGLAAEIAAARLTDDAVRITALRDRLWATLRVLPGVLLNGHREQRVSHLLSVSVTGVDGESLRFGLRELAISTGSACASAVEEPSAVLRAIGRSDSLAGSTIRFSLGRPTTAEEVDYAAARFCAEVERLRGLAPAAEIALA